ncbi:MAG: phytoene/squalene synthase family protein [Bacteroidia bacterium]|nr:phytoene/squalene synthase family protein [Bacteroidia bacterium]
MTGTELYDYTTFRSSRLITQAYSTSFSLGISMLARRFHDAIYGIYGFVRYADEIVDTFHAHEKAVLLSEFRSETLKAIERGISLNPVLHSFQAVVNRYHIEHELIEAFLESMAMDLDRSTYCDRTYSQYIYGSAEVVGLMCLRVFCEGNEAQYQALRAPAQRLGAAFQKVNFLRDLQSDYVERGRTYFPDVDFRRFDAACKAAIETDIQADFDAAREGILKLPKGARLGVYVAYIYYRKLFAKIKRLPHTRMLSERVRVPNRQKLALLATTYVRHQVNAL